MKTDWIDWRLARLPSIGRDRSEETEKAPIGGDYQPRSINFASDADDAPRKAPVCPDCGAEIHIAHDSPDVWHLTCDCETTPAFEIVREAEP